MIRNIRYKLYMTLENLASWSEDTLRVWFLDLAYWIEPPRKKHKVVTFNELINGVISGSGANGYRDYVKNIEEHNALFAHLKRKTDDQKG